MRNGERGKEEEQGEEINLFKNYLRICVFCLRGCPGALWVDPLDLELLMVVSCCVGTGN